ncbi:PREDICTED: basic salivary proline-rich protein 3-like [Dipodomys ordii]|uniref:Basic salivary proline-rich protein 3-like n=1 Tax=Dipodomys ordii TaxID=10020 RepID=A0A1S3EWP7_DIPOR|nr:PREDICTED: basic salivary proline-rich protein 3-like [Dipodomys ordii]
MVRKLTNQDRMLYIVKFGDCSHMKFSVRDVSLEVTPSPPTLREGTAYQRKLSGRADFEDLTTSFYLELRCTDVKGMEHLSALPFSHASAFRKPDSSFKIQAHTRKLRELSLRISRKITAPPPGFRTSERGTDSRRPERMNGLPAGAAPRRTAPHRTAPQSGGRALGSLARKMKPQFVNEPGAGFSPPRQPPAEPDRRERRPLPLAPPPHTGREHRPTPTRGDSEPAGSRLFPPRGYPRPPPRAPPRRSQRAPRLSELAPPAAPRGFAPFKSPRHPSRVTGSPGSASLSGRNQPTPTSLVAFRPGPAHVTPTTRPPRSPADPRLQREGRPRCVGPEAPRPSLPPSTVAQPLGAPASSRESF